MLINAEADGPVTVSYRPRYAMRSEDPRVIPATVADLVAILADHPRTLDDAKRPGAGLTCAEVVEVLVALCRDGTIPAAIEIERASMLDVLGAPTAPRVRPEGDDELFEPRGESDPKEQR